ncbi:SDR family oxidoreductase [Pontibacter silvestris]|uniref:SDR family oxidoreductase n=1 Tax=Pontibacter silvestris TaxID=2305183 RepID=A0ABW4WW21_9BACT|nr:SDR family oxidoreductase [Pontibacter silvestris]MCC9137290.1 SDR family oxidoreductase [Pontibacter silvestris]
MHETILVTGAMGTVGREVVKQLSILDDIRVRAGVHSTIKGENLKRLPDVEIVEIHNTNQTSLHPAFTHVDRVFLVTPFTKDQVEMAKTLIDEAKDKGVRHIVKLSALGAEAESGTLLGRWHREVEQYIEQSGIAYTFLRPSSFMQNFENYNVAFIKGEGKFYEATGEGKISYIDVRDVAAVAVEVLTNLGHDGKIYELTGPEAISNYEAAAILSEVTGKEISFVDISEEQAKQAMLEHQTPEWMADAMLELHSLCRKGQASKTTNTVEELVGHKPHTFYQFVKDHVQSFI